MRIRLKRGFQRKLILSAKSNQTWRQLAQKIGISENYLKIDMKNERVFLSEKTYRALCSFANINYDSKILEKLDENWGRSKGGKKASTNNPSKILLFKPSEELAELIGIVLGDGNLWVKQGGYHYVRISGDKIKDKNYLLNYVNPLFKRLFGTEMNIQIHRKDNGMMLTKGSRDIILTLNKFGIPSGNKMKNNVSIPQWILASKKYTRACIRGLIDTDGAVIPITGRNYPYIWFSCNIENLRKSFDEAMQLLEFRTSKWNIRENHGAEVYIGNKKDIVRFLKEVGLSNTKHLKYICPVGAEAKFLTQTFKKG